jgi:hypothetical protein
MASPAAILNLISNSKSENVDTRNEVVARFVEYCSNDSRLNALLQLDDGIVDVCEDFLNTGAIGDAERRALARCLCRMACLSVMYQAEWDQETLQSCLKFYSNADIVEKRMMLRAVRLFALTNNVGVALVEETGWVSAALTCEEDCYDHAVMLLDALESLASLPGVVMGAAGAEFMLTHVISSAGERERCAALRVASRVLSSVDPAMGRAACAHEARDLWLKKLHKAKIVQAVVACMEHFTTAATVQCAVRTLTELSKHKIFFKALRSSDAMGCIISQVLAKRQALRDTFVLLGRALTHTKGADAFSCNGGPSTCLDLLGSDNVEGVVSKYVLALLCIWLQHATSPDAAILFTHIDGPTKCLGFLEKADQEEARGVLTVLIRWCDNRRDCDLANQQGVDWSPLVRILAVQDQVMVERASALILWNHCLPNQEDVVGSVMIKKLIEHRALPSLLLWFADSTLVRRHLGYAVRGLRGLIPLLKKDSVALHAAHDVTNRLLELAKGKCPDAPTLYCLGVLSSCGAAVMQLLVMRDVFGTIVRCIDARVMRGDPLHADLLLGTLVTLLENAHRQGVKVSCLVGPEGTPAIKTLLKVSLTEHLPPL